MGAAALAAAETAAAARGVATEAERARAGCPVVAATERNYSQCSSISTDRRRRIRFQRRR